MKTNDLLKLSLQLLKDTEDNVLFLDKKSGLLLLKSTQNTELTATFYDPVICLVLQGSKQVVTRERAITFGSGESLIVSHGLPVVSKIMGATQEHPYIALVLGIDITIIRSLYDAFGESALPIQTGHAIAIQKASDALLESLYRLLQASQNELDALVLYSQILREVHFRLLQAPFGGMLRDLLSGNSNTSNISKAITFIRSHFDQTISVTEVAKSVGMSISSFHQHFKTITESTPLQYQKELRLLEARRLIKIEGKSVTETALKVGYESPNQFSRDYTRKFSINPSVDLKPG